MAVYKVPQDVEAEDKLVGPFTFRQFIFLIVAAISLFLTVQLFRINPLLSLITLPFLIVFGVLGVYRRPDQPVEIYLAAVLRFYLKPHRRIWDQEGILETVRITAPKKVQHQFTDGLSQNEVKSRLDTLARVMDSRGWSVKNVDINTPLGTAPAVIESDRLIMPTQQVEPNEIHASDDMLDMYNNPAARSVQQRVQQTTSQAREEAVKLMQQAAHTQTSSAQPSVSDSSQSDDVAFNPYPSSMRQHIVEPLSGSGQRNKARREKQEAEAVSNQPVSQPVPPAQNNPAVQSTSGMTQPPSDAILRLANNSDLRVSTIASEAARIEALEDDTTIKLH